MQLNDSFENNLSEFIKFLKKELNAGEEFEFWHSLDELEHIFTKLKNKNYGKIEKNVHIGGCLFLENGAVIKAGTRIEGNVYVGANSVIGPNAYLRKDVYVGENCHIANSEIKNSIILDNTNIPHYSYVGDSILGNDINLGAGTKIANLRFDDKTITVQVGSKKIDSGRRKLGSLINSGTKTGINSTIYCGKIIGKGCFIYPGRIVDRNLKDNEIVK
ncbi:MAG: hypothetical protein AABW72_06175 [archaeon]